MEDIEKLDTRKLSKKARSIIRNSAIELYKSGKTQIFIANVLVVRAATFNSWVKSYRQLGKVGMKEKKEALRPNLVNC